MISATVTSSTSPTALITSSRVRCVMAAHPLRQPPRRRAGRWAIINRSTAVGVPQQLNEISISTGFLSPAPSPRGRQADGDSGIYSGNLAIGDLPHTGGAGGIGSARGAAAVVHHGVETIALLL